MKLNSSVESHFQNSSLMPSLLKNAIVILLILLVIIIFFGSYTHNLQQTDTYAKWFYSIKTYRGQYKENGRLGEWLYMEFFYRLMGEPQHYRSFHVCVGILLDAFIVFILWKLICRSCRLRNTADSWFALLPALMLRTNVFYSDIFQFGVDAAPMFLGDLLALFAAILVTGLWGKRSFLMGTILLTASLMFRQTCLFWFVFTGLFITFCDYTYNSFSLFLRRILPLICASIIAALPVLFLINFVAPPGSRGSFAQIDLSGSWNSFHTTFASLVRDCNGVQPKWFYSMLLAVALLLNLPVWVSFFRSKGPVAFLSLLVIEGTVSLGVLFGTFFTVFFEQYLPHRTIYGFATLLPLWILFAARCREDSRSFNERVFFVFVSCLLLINLFVNLQYTQRIYQGMVETNRIDQENARYYYQLISAHEKATGVEIKKLAWHFDNQYTWTLPGVIGNGALNDRAYSMRWSQREIFPFTVGRRFQIVSFDEDIYQHYFSDKNWNGLSEEQLLFIDDTVYIVLY